MSNLSDDEIKQWYGFYEIARKYQLFNDPDNKSYHSRIKNIKNWVETQINAKQNFQSVLGIPYNTYIEQVSSTNDRNTINFINAYKEADKVMGRSKSSFLEDDDVYINCKPVDTFGKEITAETNFLKNNNMTNEILDEATANINNGELTNNIGFQTIIGVFLILFLYYVGNQVFVKFPQKIINKE